MWLVLGLFWFLVPPPHPRSTLRFREVVSIVTNLLDLLDTYSYLLPVRCVITYTEQVKCKCWHNWVREVEGEKEKEKKTRILCILVYLTSWQFQLGNKYITNNCLINQCKNECVCGYVVIFLKCIYTEVLSVDGNC